MEKKAVAGVGAPSYTSGLHMWNGTAAILYPNPTATITAASSMGSVAFPAARLRPISAIWVEPVSPKRMEKP